MHLARIWRLCAFLGLALLTASAIAADARLPFPGGGYLVLPVPEGWKHAGQPARTPTLALSPATGAPFTVLVSTFTPGAGPESATAVRKLVEAGASSARSQAVEQSLTIKELRSTGVQGHYFSATDRASKPGEFKYMTQGVFLVQGQPVAFTILTNDDSATVVEPALRMLGLAKRD